MKASNVSGAADFEHHFVLLDGLAFDAGDAFQRHHGVIAIFQRPRIDVDVLGLLLANLLDALVHVLVGDFGIVVGHLDVLVFAQLDFGNHFELGLEAQRLALVEMHVGDVGRADHVQVFGLELLAAGSLGIRLSSTFCRISPANCLANDRRRAPCPDGSPGAWRAFARPQ